jgi:hypothetical protein
VCKTPAPTLKEEARLAAFENVVLGKYLNVWENRKWYAREKFIMRRFII